MLQSGAWGGRFQAPECLNLVRHGVSTGAYTGLDAEPPTSVEATSMQAPHLLETGAAAGKGEDRGKAARGLWRDGSVLFVSLVKISTKG